MRFDGFFGNESAKAVLSGLFDSRRIPHAILIDGPRGAGKRTLARIVAAAAVCEKSAGPTGGPLSGIGETASDAVLPCGVCRQCVNALGGTHPDITVAGASGGRAFGVDAVRRLRLDAYVSPSDAARKVYILTDTEDMTEQAQNALLKILEEPPEGVLFILTCDTRAHVLETVHSRAQPVSVGAIGEEDAARALKAQCEGVSDEDARRAARISDGIVGRGKLMLDAGFGEIAAFAADFARAVSGTDFYAFLSLSARLEKDGGLYTAFCDLLPALLRDAIAVKNGGRAALSGLEAEASALSRAFGVKKLYKALLSSLEAAEAAARYANLTLALTYLFSRLWGDLHE